MNQVHTRINIIRLTAALFEKDTDLFAENREARAKRIRGQELLKKNVTHDA